MKIKKHKKLIILILVIIVVAGSIVFAVTRKGNSKEVTITEVAASRGDVTNTISGSGTVEPIEEYSIVSLVQGDIISDNVTLGNKVNAGDFLYSIDSADAEADIQKAQIALQKQQLTYEQSQETVKNLNVKSTINGRISKLYVEEGDSVNSNAKIVDIVNSEVLIVKLPFNSADADNIKVNQGAEVYLESTGEKFAGTVRKVSSGSYTTSSGALVSDIEITFANPGAVLPGETVTAIIGNYACNSEGTVQYKDAASIVAKSSGTVKNLNFAEGDKVNSGDVILMLENESAIVSNASSALSLQDSQIALKNSRDSLGDYYITSPISGTVIEKSYKAGDTLDGNRTTLAVIADMSKLSFTMDIDELDIKNIAVGQEVDITADALTKVSFKGCIKEISIIGNTSSGVTTYPVTVVIDEYEGLMPGMNVNANIISEKVENVLKVPVAAVSRGDVVMVTEEYANSLAANSLGTAASKPTGEQTDGKTSGEKNTNKINRRTASPGQIVDMPNTKSGYKWIKVTTGLSDDDYIEIKQGLTEGENVYIVTTKSSESSSTSTSSSTMSMGMQGGMMGGPPMGAVMSNSTSSNRQSRKNSQ